MARLPAIADVLVLGAGPAGATAAINLAPTHRVLLVDRAAADPAADRALDRAPDRAPDHAAAHAAAPSPRIGESLAPAARRALTAMGLWEDFVAQGHQPCHSNRARWGSAAPTEADRLRDLDGPGWHLDRARFEAWLRGVAVARGAALLQPYVLRSLVRAGTGAQARWQVELTAPRGVLELEARALIDASGRRCPLARALGARRRIEDRLVCGWLHLDDPGGAGAGVTDVIAEPEGWWYSAPLPQQRRVLAFHTDADLTAAHDARDPQALLARAAGTPEVAALLTPSPTSRTVLASGFTAAHSATLQPAVGEGWAAAGDAALAFDPLSSQGLLNSLFTGLAAAEAIARSLDGEPAALPGYAATLVGIRRAYRAHLAQGYGEERRWPEHPFWRRRHDLA